MLRCRYCHHLPREECGAIRMMRGALQWRLPERLRLSRRRAMVVASVLVLVVATALAVVAASKARTPEQRAAQASPPSPSLITVNVTTGQVVDELRLDGRIARTSTVEVNGPAAVEGTSRLVVTRTPVKAGDSVSVGRLVAEVSGRP